jgi:glycosyltransferase involved in cell wall biosynthesis
VVAVSVCVPAYNNATTAGQLIESLLSQTFTDFELRIVDDCSTDKTVEVVSSYRDPRIRLRVNDENLGAVANWNQSLEGAQGRYIKVLCGDDYLYPTCLERQVEVLEAHAAEGVVMAASRRDIVFRDGSMAVHGRGLARMHGVVRGPVALREAVRCGTNPFGEPAAVMVRADVLASCGPFSDDLPYVVDLDMWCRALERGNLFADHQALCAFRVSDSSWSHRLARCQSAQIRQLFDQVRRRHPDWVSAGDETVGAMRSRALMVGRRVMYAIDQTRDTLRRHRPLAVARTAPGALDDSWTPG